MDESSKAFTAFTTQSGCYQFIRINSSACYNKVMKRLLCDVCDVDSYVDDALGHSFTWEQHILLKNIFQNIRSAGLTIRLSKCAIGYQSVTCLGHNVGHGKITPQNCTVKRILDTPPPSTKQELKTFLGLTRWYHKFISLS